MVMKESCCKTMAKKTHGAGEAKKSTSIFAAIANAQDYFSQAHCDDDFFYSLLTINVPTLVPKSKSVYAMDAHVAHHFVFPEFGVAVAMRPGDLLLFNAQCYHCLSHKEDAYDGQPVHSTSFYLKTNIIGKNDNSLPLTIQEEENYAL
jgi:hypothetical protein